MKRYSVIAVYTLPLFSLRMRQRATDSFSAPYELAAVTLRA